VGLLFDISEAVVLGVIGADVMFAALYDYLRSNFDPCTTTTNEYGIITYICYCRAFAKSGISWNHRWICEM